MAEEHLNEKSNLVLFGLDGVELGDELPGRSTRFHFKSEDGSELILDLVTVLRLLRRVQELGLLPPFDSTWVLKVCGSYGEAI
ncbi:hypothetical protein [Brucella pituitosa]|uniref:hypothetical protein n=1 Tax=Brucella pituitosa TaxID=571256 RepID=UPI00126013D6|nr:hypothetical protein [Brucella pituitosa]